MVVTNQTQQNDYFHDVCIKITYLFSLFSSKDQLTESRVKDDKLEKLLHTAIKENKAIQGKYDQLEKVNKSTEKETKNWQQMKCSLQVN